MNHDDRESGYDELDAQIRAALSVESSPEQLHRLDAFWKQRSRAEYRRRRVRQVMAVAASILLAAALLHQLWPLTGTGTPNNSDLAQKGKSNTPETKVKVVAPERSVETPAREIAISYGRPASPHERFVLTARVQERETAKRSAAIASLQDTIAHLASEPNADPRELLAQADLQAIDVEQLLLRELPRRDEQQQTAMLQLLAVCGSSRSTSPVLRLGRRPALCQQALETIEQMVGAQGLAAAALQTNDLRVRAAIYRRLLENEASVDAYLALVQNEFLAREAIAVATEIRPPVIDRLLARLSADSQEQRLAAALVLGHANGPIVTRSLIALVSEDPGSSEESWIALMACRGPQANQFLTYATTQPQLLGSFNRARVYWTRLVH